VATLVVQVTPRAAEQRIGPYAGGVLRVRVTRPPADGDANRAVQRLLARSLDLPLSAVLLRSGARSRTKRFEVTGLDEIELARRVARAIGDPPSD
jgi:uncharacterized protein YggU (UPF0235/DUF167 family)